jgi:hypothetical protein
MQTFLASFLLFGAIMAAMAIGVMVHGRRLRGSCGGTGADCVCDDAARETCKLKKQMASGA